MLAAGPTSSARHPGIRKPHTPKWTRLRQNHALTGDLVHSNVNSKATKSNDISHEPSVKHAAACRNNRNVQTQAQAWSVPTLASLDLRLVKHDVSYGGCPTKLFFLSLYRRPFATLSRLQKKQVFLSRIVMSLFHCTEFTVFGTSRSLLVR